MEGHQYYSLCKECIFYHLLSRKVHLSYYKGIVDFRINSQLGSLSFHGRVRSKARICLRFFQVLFFLPAAAPPIAECYRDLKREIATQHLEVISKQKYTSTNITGLSVTINAGSLNGGGFAVDSVLTVAPLSAGPSATDSTTVICWNIKKDMCSANSRYTCSGNLFLWKQ